MEGQDTINLIKTRTGLPAKLAIWEERLGVAGLVVISGIVVVGALVAGLFFFLQWEKGNLEQTRDALIREVRAGQTKEGMLVSIKRRVAAIDKIRGSQRQLGTVVDTISSIAQPQQILSISYDEQQQIKLLLKTGSVEEAAGILIAMLKLVEEKRIVNPQLIGLELTKDGTVRLTVSFVHSVTPV